jgi:hypothetical protein
MDRELLQWQHPHQSLQDLDAQLQLYLLHEEEQ